MIDRRATVTGVAGLLTAGTVPAIAQITPLPGKAIWPSTPPGQTPAAAALKLNLTETRDKPDQPNRAVSGITRPLLDIRLPATPNGAGVLILGGGSYQRVVIDKEGYEVADLLSSMGFVTGVLAYRLPAEASQGTTPALQDAQRAIRLMRAATPDTKVGIMGFSAGGHLAALTSIKSEAAYKPVDAADDLSARPDFMVLVYAYLGLPRPRTAPDVATALTDSVNARTPPGFMVHAADDDRVVAANSLEMQAALQRVGVAAECHVFTKGGHGFALRRGPGNVWPPLLRRWCEEQGLAT